MQEKMRDIDDLLVTGESPKPEPIPPVEVEARETPVDIRETPAPPTPPAEEIAAETAENTPDKTDKTSLDEYGNEVSTEPKMISYEEHQRLLNETIRKRIKNWSPEVQQQVLADVQNVPVTQNENGEINWEQELKNTIKSVINETQEEARQTAWQQEQTLKQHEFEGKFNAGATRYQDFESVVLTKPLTPTMLMATKGMTDPAAFVYAACKTQPQEVERISKIADPIAQALEIGRLEEKMKKARAATKAAAPLDPTQGDIAEKPGMRSKNIDDLIHEHGRNRRR